MQPLSGHEGHKGLQGRPCVSWRRIVAHARDAVPGSIEVSGRLNGRGLTTAAHPSIIAPVAAARCRHAMPARTAVLLAGRLG